jgi:hypothetical protein
LPDSIGWDCSKGSRQQIANGPHLGLLPTTMNAQEDVVMTPPQIAKRIVQHFKPSGRILDPCKGWKHWPSCFAFDMIENANHLVKAWSDITEPEIISDGATTADNGWSGFS